MTVPFTSIALIDGLWTFTWTPVGAVRVVLWGVLLDTVTGGTYTYPASSLYASVDAAPPLEVVTVYPAPSEVNLPYLVLQWYRVNCHHYQIEMNNGGGWVFFSTLPDSPTVTILSFATALQPDQAVSTWRVIAIDSNKRQSDPINFQAMVVRPPDPPAAPSVACTGGVLTVQ